MWKHPQTPHSRRAGSTACHTDMRRGCSSPASLGLLGKASPRQTVGQQVVILQFIWPRASPGALRRSPGSSAATATWSARARSETECWNGFPGGEPILNRGDSGQYSPRQSSRCPIGQLFRAPGALALEQGPGEQRLPVNRGVNGSLSPEKTSPLGAKPFSLLAMAARSKPSSGVGETFPDVGH